MNIPTLQRCFHKLPIIVLRSFRAAALSLFLLTLVLMFAGGLRAQTGGLTTLHSFPGGYEVYDPIKGQDGNFYVADGNTQAIYKLTPAGNCTVLYSFAGTSTTGPGSGLLSASDGNFYGVASQSFESALVYRLTPNGSFSVVHVFAPSGAEGEASFSTLIQGSDGNFYGTCNSGGSQDAGTIFQLTPAGVLTVLHDFAFSEIDLPVDLVQGNDGSLYGTTAYGGPHEAGSIFAVTPTGIFTTVYSFTGADDGRYPDSLILGKNGAFYGVTAGGSNDGTIYSITSAGVHTILHAFSNPNGNAITPTGRLLQTNDGNLYGATSGPEGALFRLTPAGSLTYLYHFPETYTDTGNSSSIGDLLSDNDGNLYGLTASPDNTIFKLAPPPTVSLIAPTPTAIANTGQFAKFQVSLSSPAESDLVISYAIKGTGENGVDYALLKGTVKIKAGKTTKLIDVVPAAKSPSGQPKLTVKLTLEGANGYVVADSASTAKVKLFFPANQ